MIRVLVVDDNAFLRAALARLLESVEGITVVGECTDGAEVLATSAKVNPDVVLMDVEMPLTSGLEATRQLGSARPAVRVLIVTGSTVTAGPQEAAEAGARGYLPKGGSPEQLVEAIHTVAAGGTAWPPESEPSRSSA